MSRFFPLAGFSLPLMTGQPLEVIPFTGSSGILSKQTKPFSVPWAKITVTKLYRAVPVVQTNF